MLAVRRMYWPALNLVGPGAIKEAGVEIKNLGAKKALVVTDKVLGSLGVVKKLTDVLEANGIEFAVYDEVQPNPTMKNCHDGLEKFNSENCDLIISLGGGSPQDCAKAVGIFKNQRRENKRLRRYMHIKKQGRTYSGYKHYGRDCIRSYNKLCNN